MRKALLRQHGLQPLGGVWKDDVDDEEELARAAGLYKNPPWMHEQLIANYLRRNPTTMADYMWHE